MIALRWVLGLLVLAAPTGARADAASGFARLKTLVGAWSAKTKSAPNFQTSFHLISNDSVVVQRFVTPSGRETMTVFHLDGDRLLATHYCAQGNQPRLRLDPSSTPDDLVFVFVDATNLGDVVASHLVRLELKLDATARYTEIETYREKGKPDVTTLQFLRTP